MRDLNGTRHKTSWADTQRLLKSLHDFFKKRKLLMIIDDDDDDVPWCIWRRDSFDCITSAVAVVVFLADFYPLFFSLYSTQHFHFISFLSFIFYSCCLPACMNDDFFSFLLFFTHNNLSFFPLHYNVFLCTDQSE